MKPVNIPQTLRHDKEGFATVTIGAPPGSESTVAPIEAEVGESKFGPTFLTLMKMDASDITKLQKNYGLFWFASMSDHIHPFSMIVFSPADTRDVDPDSLESVLFSQEQFEEAATTVVSNSPEEIAQAFHAASQELAAEYGFTVPKVSWEELTEPGRQLLIHVVTRLFF